MRPTLPLAALTLAATLYAGARPVGPLPALGPFLSPTDGVFANAVGAVLPRQAEARLPGLGGRVQVVYDDRGVPHIFAATEEDAVRALGYVVARDRLFQMEVQARAGGGRLTGLAGKRALGVDRDTRRLGMAWAAERKLAALDPRSVGAHALHAYAEGVNAYIDAMRPADLPVEYRLLGLEPARWTPLNSVELLERMSWTLSYADEELTRARAATLVGAPAAAALFPVNSPLQEPVVPNGQQAARVDTAPVPGPGAPDAAAARVARLRSRVLPRLQAEGAALALDEARYLLPDDAPEASPKGRIGSNNWAVAPSRSASGHALLAGDPHLGLTLPSIWYEAHLVVPGKLDVYGVTIPGAPGIVIGFNRDVAWTFTNAYTDVFDYWAETVDDAARPTRYQLDGAWKPLVTHVETYRGPHGDTLGVDTLRYTHRGPLFRDDDGRWLSMRWLALEPSNEMDAFARVAHATSARQALDVLAESYAVPAQNMLVADREGHIGIRATGQVPERPAGETGADVHDGTRSSTDWSGWRPVSRWPQSFDPARGFLLSANQQPVDPRVDPSYYGVDFRDPWRAMQIARLLRADSSVTPDDMRRMQTDPGSMRADFFVPHFLDASARMIARADASAELKEAARLLGEWDRRYTRENERAVLFEAAMKELTDRTFDELVPAGRKVGDAGARVATPGAYVFASLFADSANGWWDDHRTASRVEHRDDVLAASLAAAYTNVRAKYGAPGAAWRWSGIRHANINHLLYLKSFGALELPVQGGPGTLAPSAGSGSDGPSWRMVVELGPELRAWGTYPGGQSGNPASARYANRIPQWQAGELDTLFVPHSAAAIPAARTSATLTLDPAR